MTVISTQSKLTIKDKASSRNFYFTVYGILYVYIKTRILTIQQEIFVMKFTITQILTLE